MRRTRMVFAFEHLVLLDVLVRGAFIANINQAIYIVTVPITPICFSAYRTLKLWLDTPE